MDAPHAVSAYVGAASAGLGFGTGPIAGVMWQLTAPNPDLRLRIDLTAARYSQTATTLVGAPPVSDPASLTHAGASLTADWSPVRRRTMRPYLSAGAGVFRFQASGPAGSNSTILNGEFASTTDVAGIFGLGLQLNARIVLEARYITVGDFHTIPITAGVRF
jgi:hypothetical protein